MLPSPFHPAIVHFPIGLALAAPFFIAGGIWAIRRGTSRGKAWGLAFVILALLAVTNFISLQTGEADEHVVEAVVPEWLIDRHEDSGKRFFFITLVVLGIGAVGFVSGTVGRVAQFLTFAGSIVALVSAWNTGHTGGDLVYRHNAAAAWVERQNPTAAASIRGMTLPAEGEQTQRE